MIDPQKQQEPNDTHVLFTSDCDLVEVKEADTQPGQPDEWHRRWMEAKWGRKKTPPANGSSQNEA
jgi:hypothetical protein